MSRMDSTGRKIIALAYFHRYGWYALMLGCVAIWPMYIMHIMGGCSMFWAIWTLVGYICEWKHIYCSWQNSHRESMTPHTVRWGHFKKSEVYFVSYFFFFMGIMVLGVGIIYSLGYHI